MSHFARRYALPTVLVIVFSGCQSNRTASDFIADAVQYREKADRKAAIIQLKNALQKEPANSEARFLLGVVYTEIGDMQSAEKELRKAKELGKEPAQLVPQLARALLARREFQAVLAELDAVSSSISSAELLSLRGQAQLGAGQNQAAKESFNAALNLQPDFPDALLGHAKLALLRQDFEAAMPLIDRALAATPRKAEVWLFKGDIDQLRAKHDAAVAAYEQAVVLSPEHLGARLSLASAHIQLGRYDRAREQIESVRKVAPADPMANYLLALTQFRQKNFAAARDSLLQVLKIAPEHPASVLLLGAVEFALGSAAQAERHLSWVLERVPDHLYARRLLGASLLRNGNADRAAEVLGYGLRQAPEDAVLLSLMAEAHMQKGDYAKATSYLEQAVALEPKSAQLRMELAASRFGTGDAESAIANLEHAIELDSRKYQADILLALSHLSRKQYDQALAALRNLEAKQPDNPLTYNLQAAAYIGKQDFQSARKHLEHAVALDPVYLPAVANLAQLDLKDQKPADAIKRYEAMLGKDKDHLQAMLALADLAYLTHAQKEDSLKWLERARRAHPKAVQPRMAKAKFYLRTGDTRNALASAEEARDLQPENPEVLHALGLIQSAAGEKEHAVTTYTRLVALQPKSSVVRLKLALAQSAAGNKSAAIQTIKKALELDPNYVDAQIALAGLQLETKNSHEALAVAKRMQKQTPQSSIGYALEGDVLMSEKKYELAGKAYTKAHEVDKNANFAIKIHQAQTLAGTPAKGDAILTRWLKENPSDISTRLYVAENWLKDGQHKKAIEQYQLVLQRQPNNLVALNNLAWAHQKLKSPMALEYAERAYELKPENAAVLDTLGWILLEHGNIARGIELLRRAVSLAPKNLESRYHLAVALATAGSNAEARKELETLLSTDEDFLYRAEAEALLRQL